MLPQHMGQLHRGLPEVLEEESNELTVLGRRLLASLYGELNELEENIERIDKELQAVYAASEACQRIADVEGIGLFTATAAVAAMSDGKVFDSGRQFAAWLGLVPRQHSSGSKTRLFGISKRGDTYLRTLFIHEARSVIYRACRNTDPRSLWIADKQRRLGNDPGLCRCREQRPHCVVVNRMRRALPPTGCVGHDTLKNTGHAKDTGFASLQNAVRFALFHGPDYYCDFL